MNQTAAESNGRLLWIGIVVAVVVVGLVAVLAARGSGGDDDAAVETGEQVAPVEVDGEVLAPFGDEAEDPAVGQTIPTVTGVDFDGDELVIGPDGSAKVIMFVAHWCPHCQREVPRVQAHVEENPLPEGVELVTISTAVETSADNYPPQQWLADEGWTAPVLVDDEVQSAASAFGLSGFPYFVAVDADGEVVARAGGELTTDEFDALVEAAASGSAS